MNSWITNDFTTGLVSVIIPTYNRKIYLQEAIQSVMAQTFRPIECIVVDDGSTDDTKTQVHEMAASIDENFKLRYIYQDNAGSQVARNNGTKASTGEFIQYLDSDDLLYPQKIEKQVVFLNKHPDCDGVWGGWAKGTTEENIIIESIARKDLLTQMLTEHCVVNFSFLMRRDIVKKIGPWDPEIKRNQEIDFQVRGLLTGATYQHQIQIGGLWRIHKGERIANTTGSFEFLGFYQKWEKILESKGMFNKQMKENISSIYLWLTWENAKNRQLNIILLEEACRLNPEIPFLNSRKMKVIRKIFPLKWSIQIWWFWARKNAGLIK